MGAARSTFRRAALRVPAAASRGPLAGQRPAEEPPKEQSLEARQKSAVALLERVGAREDDPLLRGELRRMQWPTWSPALDRAWERRSRSQPRG